MIFQHTWQQVLDGSKTQTRRLVDENEGITKPNGHPTVWRKSDGKYRRKWCVGKTYSVQPGRGQKAVGRIRITDIRREALQDISEDDAIAEGITETGYEDWMSPVSLKRVPHVFGYTPVEAYLQLWNEIHTKPGTRWEDCPDVWVLEFELVEPTS